MGKLLSRILAKMVLPGDRAWVERHPNLYLERTYAGRNQLACGAWSAVVREEGALTQIGIYGPASNLLKYPLIVRDGGQHLFDNASLEGVDSCGHCPHWRGKREHKTCYLDFPKECPFSTALGGEGGEDE